MAYKFTGKVLELSIEMNILKNKPTDENKKSNLKNGLNYKIGFDSDIKIDGKYVGVDIVSRGYRYISLFYTEKEIFNFISQHKDEIFEIEFNDSNDITKVTLKNE